MTTNYVLHIYSILIICSFTVKGKKSTKQTNKQKYNKETNISITDANHKNDCKVNRENRKFK